MRYAESDIRDGLEKLGIANHDIVFVHSSIHQLGLMRETAGEDIPGKVLEVLRDHLRQGALIMPDYRYDFSKTGQEDLRQTEGKMGILTAMLFACEDACSSNHPMFTAVGVGKRAEAVLRPDEAEPHPFGPDSFFARLAEQNGVVLFLGAGFHVNTMTVYVEREAGVTYRYDKPFEGTLVSRKGESLAGPYYHFCYPMEGRRGDYSRARADLLEAGILAEVRLGCGKMQAYRAPRFKEHVVAAIRNDPEYLRKQPSED